MSNLANKQVNLFLIWKFLLDVMLLNTVACFGSFYYKTWIPDDDFETKLNISLCIMYLYSCFCLLAYWFMTSSQQPVWWNIRLMSAVFCRKPLQVNVNSFSRSSFRFGEDKQYENSWWKILCGYTLHFLLVIFLKAGFHFPAISPRNCFLTELYLIFTWITLARLFWNQIWL